MARRSCFLSTFAKTACAGPIEPVHLLPKQVIRREVVKLPRRLLTEADWKLIWDARVWVAGCAGHHHELDNARTLRIPRHRLPPGLEDFAREYGLVRFLDREYGRRAPAQGV